MTTVMIFSVLVAALAMCVGAYCFYTYGFKKGRQKGQGDILLKSKTVETYKCKNCKRSTEDSPMTIPHVEGCETGRRVEKLPYWPYLLDYVLKNHIETIRTIEPITPKG